MRRNVSLDQISDGRLYNQNDMVKADCHGCEGCYKCCTGMGNSVILDPYDVYRLQQGLGKGLSQLLSEDAVELSVTDGVILPNMKMIGEAERCAFLNKDGRCSIHPYRPGICRLFPLGRIYEDGDFKYFLQTGECKEAGRTKVRISKWIDTPGQSMYHEFICKWHYLVKNLEDAVAGLENLERAKRLNLLMLRVFYMETYELTKDFFEQFAERLACYETVLAEG